MQAQLHVLTTHLIQRKIAFSRTDWKWQGSFAPVSYHPSIFLRGLQNSILAFPLFSEVKTDHISETKDFQEAVVAVRVRSVQMNKSVFCKSCTMLYWKSALPIFVLPPPPPTWKLNEIYSRWMLNKSSVIYLVLRFKKTDVIYVIACCPWLMWKS